MTTLLRGGHLVTAFSYSVGMIEAEFQACPVSEREERYLKPALTQLVRCLSNSPGARPEHREMQCWITSERAYDPFLAAGISEPLRIISISA